MLDNLTDAQRKIVTIISIIVGCIILIFIYNKANVKQFVEHEDSIMLAENNIITSDETKNKEDSKQIVVHIAGEVNKPGIVKLKEGERIEDAIEKAGGLTENAEIKNVNLAYILEDGVKIIIPKKDEDAVENIISEESGKNIILEEISNSEKFNLININKATQSELEKLSGVGASLASKIIDYRNKNGKFSSIEDIKNVAGIGDSKYSAIKDYICVK